MRISLGTWWNGYSLSAPINSNPSAKCLRLLTSISLTCSLCWSWEWKVKVKVAQSRPTLCNLMDSTVHGILLARILEWVAVPFSRGLGEVLPFCQVQDSNGLACPSLGSLLPPLFYWQSLPSLAWAWWRPQLTHFRKSRPAPHLAQQLSKDLLNLIEGKAEARDVKLIEEKWKVALRQL